MTTNYEHGAEAPEHEEELAPPSYAYEAGMGFAMLMEQNAKLREALADREGFEAGQRRLYDGIARVAETVGTLLAGGLFGDSLLGLVGRFVPGVPGAGAERHPADCPGCGQEVVPEAEVPADAFVVIPEAIAARFGLVPVHTLTAAQFAQASLDGVVLNASPLGEGGYVPRAWAERVIAESGAGRE